MRIIALCVLLIFFTATGCQPQIYEHEPSYGLVYVSPQSGMSYVRPTVSGNYLAGLHAMRHYDWKTAHLYFQGVAASDHSDTLLLQQALILALFAGEIEHAKNHATRILEHDADHALSLMVLAVAAHKDGDRQMMRDRLDQMADNSLKDLIIPVLEQESGLAESLVDLAQVFAQDLSDESAIIFARLSLFLDPALQEARILLAHISARYGRYEDAISHYRQVQNSQQDIHEVTTTNRIIAALMEQSGRFEDSLSLLHEIAHNKAPEDETRLHTLVQIGDLHRRARNYKDALEAYNKAFILLNHKDQSQHAEYWDLYFARGMILERLDRWKQAEQDLKTALSYRPDDPYILNYLGYSWADQGVRLDEARTMLERAALLRPQSGHIADSLGWVYFRLGYIDKAVQYLERAVALLPYEAVINDHLGDAYWVAGRYNEARFQWQRALNHDEDDELSKSALRNKLVRGIQSPVPAATQMVREALTQHE